MIAIVVLVLFGYRQSDSFFSPSGSSLLVYLNKATVSDLHYLTFVDGGN